MSANINLDTVLKPFVIATNFGINSLTKLYYSKLNPAWDASRKASSAATFHYNIKVTLHNLATAYLATQVARKLLGRGTLRSLVLDTVVMLFTKTVLEKTLSVQNSAKTLVAGVLSTISSNESLEEASLSDSAYAAICIAASKAQSKVRNTSWKEDLLVIQGYPVLKNWAPIKML